MVGAAELSAPSPATSHYADLDGLRGVLALSVVLYHLGFNSFTQRMFHWSGFRFDLAVDVFFVLSGFVLTRAVQKGVSLPAFAIKRVFRLMPVFYVSTIITILALGERPNPLETVMAVPFSGRDPINFPAWSICWEFYLPIAAVALRKTVSDALVRPLLVVALVLLGLADWVQESGTNVYLIRAFLGLFAGHLLWLSQLELRLPLEIPTAAIFLVMAGAAFMPMLAVFLPMVAVCAVLAGRTGGSLLGSGPAQFLGTISYTLYLLHIPVLYSAQALFSGVGNNAPFKLVLLLVCFVTATLVTYAVELPGMRIGARLARLAVPPAGT